VEICLASLWTERFKLLGGDSSLVIAIFYARIRFAVLRTTALYKQEAM
jgi:hypothetical protein